MKRKLKNIYLYLAFNNTQWVMNFKQESTGKLQMRQMKTTANGTPRGRPDARPMWKTGTHVQVYVT